MEIRARSLLGRGALGWREGAPKENGAEKSQACTTAPEKDGD